MSHIDVGLVFRTMGRLRGSQIGVAMFSVLLLQLTPNVFAQDSINDSKENLDQVRSSIANLQKSLSEKTIEFNSARKQVLEIERRLHLARRETKKFTRELGEKSLKITALVEQREALTRMYSDTANTLSDIVVAKYRLSREPKLKLLLNSTHIAELQRNLKYHDYFAELDNGYLADQAGQIDEVRRIESTVKLEANKLRHLQVRSSEHLNALNEALAGRNTVATSLEQLVRDSKLELGRLRDDEVQLEKLVGDVRAIVKEEHAPRTPFKGLKGKLSWPTLGRIAKAPGGAMRAGGAKWDGVIIESEPGSDVTAIAGGRIAFADWFRNLGLLVIVDHGDGYMSLYGHNQELYKTTGERVESGEIVSMVGDTGGQTTTGVYFEIRENGTPQDPRLWCKR